MIWGKPSPSPKSNPNNKYFLGGIELNKLFRLSKNNLFVNKLLGSDKI